MAGYGRKSRFADAAHILVVSYDRLTPTRSRKFLTMIGAHWHSVYTTITGTTLLSHS